MAGRDDYSPVDRRSFSGDDGSQSLLSHDEKIHGFERRRPAQRRLNFALKTVLLVVVLIVHAGLVAFLLNWFGIAFWGGSRGNMTSNNGMNGQHSNGGHSHGGHSDNSCQTDSTHHRYGFEGVIPAVYKDPSAEFSQVNPCGHSAAEARERGCRYGMLYGAWLPEECYDEETEENFKKYTNWRFWLQPNRTEEVSWDEVAKGEHEYVLVEWEYHQRHCAEMNRRLFTAVARRGLNTLDSYLSQWDHTDHCAHSAMEQRPLHELNAILWRKFPDCGLVRWKNGAKY